MPTNAGSISKSIKTTPADGTVTAGKLASSVISGQTELTSVSDALKHLVDDSGTLKYIARDNLFVQPSFSVSLDTQATSLTGYQKVKYDTKSLDTEGDFDNTTNYRHTPSIAGKWLYTACWQDGSSTAKRTQINIYKNGSIYQIGQSQEGTSSHFGHCQSSWIVDMNGSTDYVEIYSWASATYSHQGDTDNTWFSGVRISP